MCKYFPGIYGVPKDQVARAAAASVIHFVKDFADPCLKHIHFVDVIDDMVQLYQAEFDKYVKKSVFGVYNKYSEWSKWKAGHSDVPNWTNKSSDVDTTGFSSSFGRGQILQRQLSNPTRSPGFSTRVESMDTSEDSSNRHPPDSKASFGNTTSSSYIQAVSGGGFGNGGQGFDTFGNQQRVNDSFTSSSRSDLPSADGLVSPKTGNDDKIPKKGEEEPALDEKT